MFRCSSLHAATGSGAFRPKRSGASSYSLWPAREVDHNVCEFPGLPVMRNQHNRRAALEPADGSLDGLG
jgi:hypothetical protein